jgi:hypothetical protein
MDWLGSGRVMLRARPPASSTEKPTGSSNQDPHSEFRRLAQEGLNRAIEAGFRAQDAYQLELQRQSMPDGSQASPPLPKTE